VLPRQEQIQGPEQTYHLEPKVMQVLVVLAEHAQQPVTRDMLLDTVWAGTVVGDEVVSRAISLLRGYLGDERTNPRYIRTIPKTGYELIHPIAPLLPDLAAADEPRGGLETATYAPESRAASTQRLETPAQDAPLPRNSPSDPGISSPHARSTHRAGEPQYRLRPGRRAYWIWAVVPILLVSIFALSRLRDEPETATVAVLPFNINGDASELSYIREGLADYLINQLSQASNLRVVAKRSSFANFDATIDARGLGSMLGADYIIDGTLDGAQGEQLTATVYLVDTRSGTNRAARRVAWAEADIPGLQHALFDSALAALGKVLRVRFDEQLRPPKPANPAAYRAYLEAKYQWSLRGDARIRRAIGLLQDAIRLEPTFAEAHLALAQALAIEPLYTDRSVAAGFAAARTYAARAQSLEPTFKPDVDALEGYMLKQEWRWPEALNSLQGALEADPDNLMANYWYSMLLSTLGRYQEALKYIEAAHRQDPISPFLNDRLAVANLWLGNMEAAAERYEIATRLGYLESIQPKSLFVFLHRTARFDQLRLLLLRQGYSADWVTPFVEALRQPEQRDAATPVLEAAMTRGEIPEDLRFGIWAFLGDAGRAIAAFQIDPKTPDIEYLWARDSGFLRKHPDFPGLLEKLNLTGVAPRA
jgi:DNA-binding winged helix-turn-helix (wHTH) protein/TolB-like protein